MNYLFVFLLFFTFSCGGSKDSPSSEKNERQIDNLDSKNTDVVSSEDSDGDGIPDSLDERPFIADIPIIGGEFFNKMRVEIWSTDSYSAKVSSWEINSDGIEFESGKTTKSSRKAPRSMMDYYLKKGARRMGWKGEQVPLDINTDYMIDSFASPMLTRDEMLTISNSLRGKDLSKTLSANIDFQSDISVQSSKYKHFKDLTLNVFYISPKGNVQELDNLYIPGEYEFNQVHPISSRIVLKDQGAVEALLVSGSRIFVKIEDFTIIDTAQKYRDIISSVREKSLPLIVSMKDSKVSTFYVGTNGASGKIGDIIEKAYGGDVRVSSSSIDSIAGISNRMTRRGDWNNEFSQWVIGTNIYSSPFDSLFGPKDTITLGYYSNYEPESYPVFMQRKEVSLRDFEINGLDILSKHVFSLEDVSQKIEIVVKDTEIFVPIQKEWAFTGTGNCGGGGWWLINRGEYRGYALDFQKMDLMNEILKSEITISNSDGPIISGVIGKSEVFGIQRDPLTNDIVISILDLWKWGRNLGRLDVVLSLALKGKEIREGEELINQTCKQERLPSIKENKNSMSKSSSSVGVRSSIYYPRINSLISVLGY